MAAELDTRCPICLDSWEEASYVLPCLHQFCYPCIVRWAETKPECPLCKRRVTSILHSVRADDDYEERVISPPVPLVVVPLTGGAPGHPTAHGLHQPAAARPPAAGPLPRAPVGGFHASTWASIFRVHPAVLQPLLPWLRQELGQLLEDAQEAAAAQRLIISSLRRFGLIEDSLVRVLQTSLGWRTRSFVQQLIDTVVRRCSGEVRRQLGLEDTRAAGERESSPDPAPEPPAPSPALQGAPSSAPNAPHSTHGEREELQEITEKAVPGPSTSSRGSQRSPGRPRRAPKRRAGSPEEPSQPRKKPPHHQ